MLQNSRFAYHTYLQASILALFVSRYFRVVVILQAFVVEALAAFRLLVLAKLPLAMNLQQLLHQPV